MTRTNSRIRHDYKPLKPSKPAKRGRPVALLPAAFAAAAVLAVAIAVFFLRSGADSLDEANTPNAPVAAAGESVQQAAPITLTAAPAPAADESNDQTASPAPDQRRVPKSSNAESADDYIRDIPVALPLPPASDPEAMLFETTPEPGTELKLTIKPGNTLDGLFGRHGLSRGDLAILLRNRTAADSLAKLMPGDEIIIRHDGSQVLALSRALDEERTLHVTRQDNAFASRVDTNPVERVTAHADGTIDSSLFLAAKAAGISDNLAMKLAGIYAWDIDFVLDIRRGDRFTLLYEEVWQDGEKIRDGDIIAAEFVNSGDAYAAARYTDPEGNVGYFTPDGNNMRKAFIRAPIAISPRVTSNFNPRRLHPVHKKVRPHRGVDYGAPTGTPIKAAGDGKVIFRGRKGGYGNTIILQHGGNITTLYAHMSKFSSKAKKGNRVKQGDTIGYVGATGTVTAAHLHYEYRVNGVHRNPRTVTLPKAEPVPARFRDDFKAASEPLFTQLALIKRDTRLARVFALPSE